MNTIKKLLNPIEMVVLINKFVIMKILNMILEVIFGLDVFLGLDKLGTIFHFPLKIAKIFG